MLHKAVAEPREALRTRAAVRISGAGAFGSSPGRARREPYVARGGPQAAAGGGSASPDGEAWECVHKDSVRLTMFCDFPPLCWFAPLLLFLRTGAQIP